MDLNDIRNYYDKSFEQQSLFVENLIKKQKDQTLNKHIEDVVVRKDYSKIYKKKDCFMKNDPYFNDNTFESWKNGLLDFYKNTYEKKQNSHYNHICYYPMINDLSKCTPSENCFESILKNIDKNFNYLQATGLKNKRFKDGLLVVGESKNNGTKSLDGESDKYFYVAKYNNNCGGAQDDGLRDVCSQCDEYIKYSANSKTKKLIVCLNGDYYSFDLINKIREKYNKYNNVYIGNFIKTCKNIEELNK